MKILVLTSFYPQSGKSHERMFVHVRNKFYQNKGIDVTVLNFSTNEDYEIDKIKVISLETYKNLNIKYDILISHSSNLRNHYIFLNKYSKKFKHIIFFFHGHEILYMTKDYPKPYNYTKQKKWYKILFQKIYDQIKMEVWKRKYKKLAYKSEFIFVSNWLFKKFKQNLKLNEKDILNNYHIINNSIGEYFEFNSYNLLKEKEYDFITIRSNLDGSKYCIDLVNKLAIQNPQKTFLIIGKGDFYNYNKKPNNVKWISKTINHDEMGYYLNISRCGILLTRQDTQGVMACEFVAFGIPTITSDIEISREIFKNNENVNLISNDFNEINLEEIILKMQTRLPYKKDLTYSARNTIEKEIKLFYKMVKKEKVI